MDVKFTFTFISLGGCVMNKYTFSTQSGKAYYCNSIPGFIKDKSTSIIGQLVYWHIDF